MEEIKGYIKNTLFHNEKNKYSVIKIRLDQKKDENIIVVGYFDVPSKENLIRYKGEYTDHPKYGRQFLVESYEKVLPNDDEGAIRYLSSASFKGIGAATAKVIVDTLGKDCLDLIKNDFTILDKVNIKQKHKDTIIEVLSMNNHLEEAQRLFIGHGLNMKELIKLDAFYGENLVTIILNNPYQMVEDISGIGFKTADKIAEYVNIAKDDPRRIESAIIYSLSNSIISSVVRLLYSSLYLARNIFLIVGYFPFSLWKDIDIALQYERQNAEIFQAADFLS